MGYVDRRARGGRRLDGRVPGLRRDALVLGGARRREQVSFSWRLMPPDTGGRGSYGHRHPGQEEIYFVVSGTLTFKVGDDVFEAGPQTAVRIDGRGVLLGPQRHRRGRRAADLLDPARRAGDRAAAGLLARVSAPEAFGGFRRTAFEWFERARARQLQALLRGSSRGLRARTFAARSRCMLEELTNEFDGRVKMFRQHRDIRFSKDKSPYKTATYGLIRDRPGSDAGALRAAHLRRPVRRQRLLPAQPGPAGALSRARRRPRRREPRADARRAQRRRVRRSMGEELQTVPRGYPRDHPRAAVLRRRSVAGGRRLKAAKGRGISRERALAHVRDTWRALAPVNAWLDRNVGAAEVDPRG